MKISSTKLIFSWIAITCFITAQAKAPCYKICSKKLKVEPICATYKDPTGKAIECTYANMCEVFQCLSLKSWRGTSGACKKDSKECPKLS